MKTDAGSPSASHASFDKPGRSPAWSILWFGLIALFVAPYFFAWIVSRFSLSLPSDFAELVTTSVLQASLSACLSMVVGGVGALGLLRRSRRWEAVALAPAVAPAIAIVLGFITLFPQWKGWSAVAFAHALGSSGLVAVVITRQVRTSIGASLELAWTEGASRSMLWFRGVLPMLRGDLIRLALSVFASSLASFSIPLLLGGSRATTVEIAIHHAIRFENAWDVAAGLSIFQWALMLVLVLGLKNPVNFLERRTENVSRIEVGRALGFDLAVLILFVAPFVILYALLRGPLQGFAQLQSAGIFDHSQDLILAFQGSLVTGTLAGVFSGLILFSFAAVFPSERARVWMSGYVAPSVAITGFATLLLGWRQDPSFTLDALRISIGASLLFTPVLWRLRWEQSLALLDGQVKVAQTLGASHGMIVRRVLAPQIREIVFWSAGLISFWVWSDYALGSIAASRSMTLALLAKSLLGSYRLEAASLLILVCLVLGGLSYRAFTWAGANRVTR